MATFAVLNWIWMALFCEIFFRIVSCVWAHRSIKDSPTPEDTNDGLGKEDKKVEFELRPRKSRCFYKRCKKGLAGLSEELKTMFGGKEEKQDNVTQDDPLVKEGLRREDKITNGGNVKVSSYYDKEGKMVFQRETILPPPTVNDIRDTSNANNNPPFYMKPQESAAKTMSHVEEQIDKAFGNIYGVKKDIPDSQKTIVDDHIDKTFKDIYDMVLPSVF